MLVVCVQLSAKPQLHGQFHEHPSVFGLVLLVLRAWCCCHTTAVDSSIYAAPFTHCVSVCCIWCFTNRAPLLAPVVYAYQTMLHKHVMLSQSSLKS
jgi:hypothetical protein